MGPSEIVLQLAIFYLKRGKKMFQYKTSVPYFHGIFSRLWATMTTWNCDANNSCLHHRRLIN